MPIKYLSPQDSQRQLIGFVDFFEKEFMAEISYLEETARGNIPARTDASLTMVFNVACALVSLAPIPGGVLAFMAIPHVLNAVVKVGTVVIQNEWSQKAIAIGAEYLSGDIKDQVTTLQGGAGDKYSTGEDMPIDTASLSVLARWLGVQLARRYEQVLTERLSTQPDQALMGLARVAARRCLAYLSENPLPAGNHQVRTEHLLAGVLVGAAVPWYHRPLNLLKTGESLQGSDEAEKLSFTAEKLLVNGAWIKDSDAGEVGCYTHKATEWISASTSTFKKTSVPLGGLPTYGYVAGFVSVLDLGLKPYTGTSLDLREWQHRRLQQPVTKNDVSAYLSSAEVKKARPENRTASQSFIQFLHQRSPGTFSLDAQAVLSDDLSEFELRSGNFQGVDFSGSRLSGDISYASFERGRLLACTGTTLRAVVGSTVNFAEAELGFSTLSEGKFDGTVNFTQADLTCVDLTNTIFGEVEHVGAVWHKAVLTNVNYHGIRDAQAAQVTEMAAEQTKQRAQLRQINDQIQALEARMQPLLEKCDQQTERREQLESLLVAQVNRLKFEAYATEKLEQLSHQSSAHSDAIARLGSTLTTVREERAAGERMLQNQIDRLQHDVSDLKTRARRNSEEKLTIKATLQAHDEHLAANDKRMVYLEQRFISVQLTGTWEHLDYPRDTCFQPRPSHWSALESRFATTRSTPVVLSGLGGMGKTSLASEWAHAQKASGRYSAVRWVNMDTPQQLNSLENWARDLSLPYEKKSPTEIWTMIAQRIASQSWLIVFDNVENYAAIQVGLSQFSLTPQQHILITSRDETSWTRPIRVDVYSPEESVAYIQQQMEAADHSGFEISSAQLLAERLGHHPLALELAMASICLDQLSLNSYQERLERQGLTSLNNGLIPAQQSQARLNVHQTLTALWDDSLPKLSIDALKLLRLLSFIDAQGGARSLLLTLFQQDEPRLSQALCVLREQSFVKRVDVGNGKLTLETWCVHRLLQEVVREKTLQQLAQDETAWPTFLNENWDAVEAVFPEKINTTEDVGAITRGVAHGHAFENYIKTVSTNWPTDMRTHGLFPWQAKVLAKVGAGESNMACYAIAKESLSVALTTYRAIHGETANHPGIATTLSNLGSVYYSQGDYPRAIEYHELSLAMERAIHGQTANHPGIATTLSNLGNVYCLQGDYPRAIEYYELSLTMKRAIYGQTANHPDIAATIGNLGNVYYSQGDYPRAIEYHELSLTMRRAIYGQTANHPGIATTLRNLGSVYHSQGDYPRAIEYHELSLTMNRAIYGQTANHPGIATTLDKLGIVYDSQGDYPRAIVSYEASLAMRRVIYGETANHPDIATILKYLNLSRQAQTKSVRGEDCTAKAVSLQRRFLEPATFNMLHQKSSSATMLSATKNEFDSRQFDFNVSVDIIKTLADFYFGEKKHNIDRGMHIYSSMVRGKINLSKELRKENPSTSELVTGAMILNILKKCEGVLVENNQKNCLHDVVDVVWLNSLLETEQRSRAILPIPLRQNIHSLFRQGYRFSTVTHGNELTIKAISPGSSGSTEDDLLSGAETKFQQVLSDRSEHPVVKNQGNHRWSVRSNAMFITQMNRELQNVVVEYEESGENTQGALCTVS